MRDRYVWIRDDIGTQGTNDELHQLKLEVEVSPYDIPKMIVGIKSPDSGRFTIVFKYIDEEEAGEELNDRNAPWITIVAGKHSSKILEIRIDLDHASIPSRRIKKVDLRTQIVRTVKDLHGNDRNRTMAAKILDSETYFNDVTEDLLVGS